jgi:hypothetical protein
MLPSSAVEAEQTAGVKVWSPAARVAYRFGFCYLGLYSLIIFANVEEHLPYERLWQAIVPWVGAHILHLQKPITYFPTGSGDKASDWLLLLCHIVLSVVATVVWSLVDRRRANYERLDEWLRVALRYAVAFTLFSYGATKVVPLQFPAPSLARLLEPLGEFSPMGLLWTFIGASTSYNFFAGVAEIGPAVLLLFRRTSTLGALLSAAVMANVAMLNFAYDVPVKLLASHLVLISLYLAAPDAMALWRFFVANQRAALIKVTPHFQVRRWRVAGSVLKAAVIAYVLISTIIGVMDGRKQYGSLAPKSPLYGIWNVEEYSSDSRLVPASLNEPARWRYFISDYPQYSSVRLMDNSAKGFGVKYDVPERTITGQGGAAITLKWSRPDAEHLVLDGTVDGHRITAKCTRVDETKTALRNRGFHWVSEYPFNR